MVLARPRGPHRRGAAHRAAGHERAAHLRARSHRPRRYTLVDADATWVVSDDALLTSPGWSPFAGMRVRGRVREVRIRGARRLRRRARSRAAPGTGGTWHGPERSTSWPGRRPRALVRGIRSRRSRHARTMALLRRADASARRSSRWRAPGPTLAFPTQPTWVGGVHAAAPAHRRGRARQGRRLRGEAEALAAVGAGPGHRARLALAAGARRRGGVRLVHALGHASATAGRCSGATRPRAPCRTASACATRARPLPPSTWPAGRALPPRLGRQPRAQPRRRGRRQRRPPSWPQAAADFERAFAGRPNPPAWYTLNLSCPNTEDDPHGRQTEQLARRLVCGAPRGGRRARSGSRSGPTSPTSSSTAWWRRSRMPACAPSSPPTPWRGRSPGQPPSARASRARPCDPSRSTRVARLAGIIARRGAALDIVGCGGILDGCRPARLPGRRRAGRRCIYSALVFRGPLAGALILREAKRRSDA